jgi:ribosome-associated protein
LIIESRQKALLAARAALEKHAEDLVLLDVKAHSTVADFFLLATAGTTRQIAAIVEWIDRELRRRGGRLHHGAGLGDPPRAKRRPVPRSTGRTTLTDPAGAWKPGADGVAWVLMDCGDLVVHLFNPPAREFYQLERLWADAPRIRVES